MYLVRVHIIVVSLNTLWPSGYLTKLLIRLCKIAYAREQKLGLENCVGTHQLYKLARDVKYVYTYLLSTYEYAVIINLAPNKIIWVYL